MVMVAAAARRLGAVRCGLRVGPSRCETITPVVYELTSEEYPHVAAWCNRVPAVVLAAVVAGMVTASCFGKFAVGVTNEVRPSTIVPGTQLRQEIVLEADGAIGAAVRQSMSQTISNNASADNPWQVRDNSDASTVRLRLSRVVGIDEGREVRMNETGVAGLGVVRVASSDYLVVRRYALTVTVQPSSSSSRSPSSSVGGDAFGEQLARAALAGVTFDQYAIMPGILLATNGIPGDDGRIVWHLQWDSTATQTLTAESLFIDWPRIGAIALLLVVLGVVAVLARRRPAPFSGRTPASW